MRALNEKRRYEIFSIAIEEERRSEELYRTGAELAGEGTKLGRRGACSRAVPDGRLRGLQEDNRPVRGSARPVSFVLESPLAVVEPREPARESRMAARTVSHPPQRQRMLVADDAIAIAKTEDNACDRVMHYRAPGRAPSLRPTRP